MLDLTVLIMNILSLISCYLNNSQKEGIMQRDCLERSTWILILYCIRDFSFLLVFMGIYYWTSLRSHWKSQWRPDNFIIMQTNILIFMIWVIMMILAIFKGRTPYSILYLF